jgi:hypothetical protein
MKKKKFLLLILFTTTLFYSCETNTEDLTTDPILDPQEDPVLNSNLSFEEVYTFEDDLLGGPYMGMTYSPIDNNLFISCRENKPSGTTTEEEVFKLNLDSYLLTRRNVSPGGFITKQLTLINDTLVSIGGTEFKFYDTNFEYAGNKSYFNPNCGPDTDPNCFGLWGFGVATHNNDTYILGGEKVIPTNLTTPVDRSNTKIRILRGDITGNLFEELAIETPETMIGASGAISNNKLYVFGGAIYDNISEGTNKIFIYPLDNSPNYEELSMTVSADITFVHKYGEIILIAGQKGLFVGEKTSFIGIFDTNTNTFEEIETNLDSERGTKAIHQMIVKDDKIIVLFGHKAAPSFMVDAGAGLPQSKWSILSANLLDD